MCIKLKEEFLECLLLPTPCWHIDEKIHPPISVNIQKLPQLERETCPLGIDHDKDHLSPKSQLSSQPHQKEQPVKSNQLKYSRR
jgi:hypothetical protein